MRAVMQQSEQGSPILESSTRPCHSLPQFWRKCLNYPRAIQEEARLSAVSEETAVSRERWIGTGVDQPAPPSDRAERLQWTSTRRQSFFSQPNCVSVWKTMELMTYNRKARPRADEPPLCKLERYREVWVTRHHLSCQLPRRAPCFGYHCLTLLLAEPSVFSHLATNVAGLWHWIFSPGFVLCRGSDWCNLGAGRGTR